MGKILWELFRIRQVIRKIVELKCNFKIRLPTIAKINFTTWYWFMLRFTTKKKEKEKKLIITPYHRKQESSGDLLIQTQQRKCQGCEIGSKLMLKTLEWFDWYVVSLLLTLSSIVWRPLNFRGDEIFEKS